MKGGAGLALLGETIAATVAQARAAGGDIAEYAQQLEAAVVRVGTTTATLWAGRDPELALANSSVYLEAVGHVVVAWIWLEQLLAVGDRQGAFFDGKRAAAKFFYRFELPKTGPQFDLLDSLDRTTLDVSPDVF
jgi:butyryl-CoA dehydrogenase